MGALATNIRVNPEFPRCYIGGYCLCFDNFIELAMKPTEAFHRLKTVLIGVIYSHGLVTNYRVTR